MKSPGNWSFEEPSKETVENLWKHEEGDEVRVEQFSEDDTWDAFLNDRLIENYDTLEEAREKAEELLESHPEN